MWLNRYLCDVIEEARTCVKTLNFAILPSLLEEIQIMGNRMEAKLEDVKALEGIHDRISVAKKELKDIELKVKLKGDSDES